MHNIDLTTQLDRRKMLKGIGVFSAVGALAAATPQTAFARSYHHGRHGRNNQALLDAYWATLNTGMASATGDFSAMAGVYAADGMLTQSNPAGITTAPHRASTRSLRSMPRPGRSSTATSGRWIRRAGSAGTWRSTTSTRAARR